MRRALVRRLLHIAGVALLLALIPLSASFGAVATITICILALACFAGAGFMAPKVYDPGSSRRAIACPYEVVFDEHEVKVLFRGEPHESVAWSELKAVGVRIDESFLPAPWWLLLTSTSSGCMYPSEAKGAAEMLREMQGRLQGFDNRAVIESMGLMEGGKVIWSIENAA